MAPTFCTRVGSAISGQRPFSHLPQLLQTAVATSLDRVFQVCVTAGFETVQCQGCESCWRVAPSDPAYYVRGLSKMEFEATARIPGLGTNILSVRGDLAVAAVGYLIDLTTGLRHEAVAGDCPRDCTNQQVSGKLAIELVGGLSISSALLNSWNLACVMTFFDAYLAGAKDDVLDFIEGDMAANPIQGRFSVDLVGSGQRAGGAVFNLGDFNVTPP